VVGPYGWGWLSDRTGERVKLLRYGATASMLVGLGLFLNLPVAALFGVLLVMFIHTSFMMPMSEAAMAHRVTHEGQLDVHRYGRVRLWGSWCFLVTVVAAGWWFERHGLSSFPAWTVGTLVLVAVSVWWMPDLKEQAQAAHERLPIGPILRQAPVRWLFVAIFFHIFAHVLVYVFFSLYLDELGYSKTAIGLFWAVGVIVEIAWFYGQGRWSGRLSWPAWLVVASMLMVLRMVLTAGAAQWWWVLVLAQALHQHCQSRGAQAAEAVVINMLDQKLWNPNPDFLSYTLSKAALEAANTLLAQALAPLVRVVGVAPGLTLTSHMLDDDKFQKLHTLSPLGRSSSVEEVVSSVVFAVHNRAMTGTTLLVDGGQHLMKFERDFSLM
jgi:predicted MFS family arabinose efflux permease